MSGYSGDNGPATSAELSSPLAVALDSAGNLYLADDGNAAVRRVDAVTGVITTVAGNGTAGYSGDGGPATSAQLALPGGLVLDGANNLYITDGGNDAIRKVSASTGIITTIAGVPTFSGYVGDGGPATQSLLSHPSGPALDPQGDIFFSDSNNNVVRGVSAVAALVDLGPVAVGSVSNAQDVTVTNNGNLLLTLTSLSITANFNLNGPDTTCTGSTTLNPGDSCVLGIEFAPVTGGSQSGAVNLVDNVGPQSVNLTGTGIPLSTTTTVISSLNPSAVGQSVTFTATVAPVEQNIQQGARRRVQPRQNSTDGGGGGGGGGAPAEMVSFYDGSTLLGTVTAASGVATLTTSNLIVGAHNITAVFLGNAAYITSTSAILMQVVTGTATATTLVAAPNPATAGQTVTLTATGRARAHGYARGNGQLLQRHHVAGYDRGQLLRHRRLHRQQPAGGSVDSYRSLFRQRGIRPFDIECAHGDGDLTGRHGHHHYAHGLAQSAGRRTARNPYGDRHSSAHRNPSRHHQFLQRNYFAGYRHPQRFRSGDVHHQQPGGRCRQHHGGASG